MSMPRGTGIVILLLVMALRATTAAAAVVQPFPVTNQGPLALLYSLPDPGDWRITPKGATAVGLAMDLANTYTLEKTSREELLLDGESWRTTVTVRRGVGDKGEIGLALPVMGIGGGTFDGFITGWHDFFGLPQGGRDSATKGQLHYRYRRDGVTRLDQSRSSSGVGDLQLFGGWQVLGSEGAGLALRGMLSLPTGDSGEMRGSGAPGGSLWLTGGVQRPVSLGQLAAWGSLGGMVLGTGDILSEQQRNFVAIGTVGIGWAPAEVIDFKLQVNGNTPLYSGSDLAPLNSFNALLVMGGSLHFSPATTLTIGVSEDVQVGTAADVALHVSLQTIF